ncbi:MAG: isovaleryl-CoA dehydrogenase [Gemmatimonadetes bacterium]|nr:isovaleryl-CoA dehydrogenase [Gemmatimonadota bacterium]
MAPATHAVFNQVPPLLDYNLFTSDAALVEAVGREGAGWARQRMVELGARLGSEEVVRWGFLANEHPPVLHTHDPAGNRIDEVEFHPDWHRLMHLGVENGLHNLPWRDPRPGAHVARAALCLLAGQNEAGHVCPLSMTHAAVPALRRQPELAAEWEAGIGSTTYDPRFRPPAEKKGVLLGMAMTEKQGGSDVRANTTRAEPVGATGPGREYLLTGHKWFCSAPMCDAFLVLAQAPGGLSCFLLPRWTPDGVRNRFFIQRLKHKLGNRSNASSELELDGAWARLLGDEGRGIASIIEMVNHTRLDCTLLSTALMRRAVAQATHHCSHRAAFGKRLVEQPLMRNVLADLCVESEAATVLGMRLARAFDSAAQDGQEGRFRRIANAVSKYWICKRAPSHVLEAMECLGGNGYVEESILPRLYREAPVNSMWEGSANVICLDVLRAMDREEGATEAFMDEVRLGLGADRRLDAFIDALDAEIARPEEPETRARRLVERMALALQASLLVRHAPPALADAFCASRLGDDRGRAFGTLAPGIDVGPILERASPAVSAP